MDSTEYIKCLSQLASTYEFDIISSTGPSTSNAGSKNIYDTQPDSSAHIACSF